MRYIIIIICLFSSAYAQKVTVIAQQKGISFRGLSVVSNKIVWVSGSSGTIGKSVDAGKTWQWLKVKGYETKEFRDIEAFDEHTAIIMAVGEPAVILKTEDDGKRWKPVYTNSTPGMFLDAMEFWNDESGIVIGDPVGGRFFVARTFDGGNNWRPLSSDKLPIADSGEACFAASGTNVRALTRGEACFISGGSRSRFFFQHNPVDLPLLSGKQTQGANSLAVWYKHRKLPLVVVTGGDFDQPHLKTANCAISGDGGKTWSVPQTAPNGYRSCVEFLSATRLVTCGTSGVDISDDGGMNWKSISTEGYHTCRKAKKGKTVFLAGSGKIGKLEQ